MEFHALQPPNLLRPNLNLRRDFDPRPSLNLNRTKQQQQSN